MFGPVKKDEAKIFFALQDQEVWDSLASLSYLHGCYCFIKKSCLKETFYFIVLYQILLADRSAFTRDFFEAAPHSVFKTVHK